MQDENKISSVPEADAVQAPIGEIEEAVEGAKPAGETQNGAMEPERETAGDTVTQEKPSKKGRLKRWWAAHKPTKRRIIQLYVALLCNANIKGYFTGRIFTGATKYACVPGLNCYSCPGAVGACPLGALQNAFAQSGTRLPYYLFGILLLYGILFARTVCGFLCPFGFGQDLVYKIKTPKLRKSRVTRVLSYLKYVVLAVFVVAIPLIYAQYSTAIPAFCKYICPAGTLGGAIGLLINPANADLYEMLGGLFTWKFAVAVAIVAACIFIYRFFCRFLCPLGAIYGFFNKISLIGVKLDENKCTDCGLCVAHCKMDIRKVGDHECINCGECIAVCPAKAIRWKGSKLIVHQNAVEAPLPEEKPLSSLLHVKGETQDMGTANSVKASIEAPAEPVSVTMETTSGPMEAMEPAEPARAVAVHRGAAFWMKLSALLLAGLVLLGALVYYNFIDTTAEADSVAEGEVCPDFTLEAYNGREDFTLSACRGKVVIVNFWATWCGPCVTELPTFEEVQEEYGDSIVVVAVHSASIAEDVQAFLNENTAEISGNSKAWAEWSLTFVQDTGTAEKSDIFTMLGGRDSYPVTAMIDGDGVVRAVRQGSVTYSWLTQRLTLLGVQK